MNNKNIVLDGVEYTPIIKTEPFKGGRFKPEINQEWYLVDSDGEVRSGLWIESENGFDNNCYNQGNCYETKEQAQAVSDLRKHIHSFEMPEDGEEYFRLDQGKDTFMNYFYFNNALIDYSSGLIMPSSSTKKERAERLRLLNAAHIK